MSTEPTPSTPAAPATSAAEQFLTEELRQTRSALRNTRIGGIVVVLVILGYTTYVGNRLREDLTPVNAASLATSIVSAEVNSKTDVLAQQIKTRIPALVASVPDHLREQLPKYRAQLEQRLEQYFSAHCAATSVQLGKHLDDFLQANIVQIRTILNAGDNPDSFKSLGPDMEKHIMDYLGDKSGSDRSIKDQVDSALAELQRVAKQVDRLATASNLTAQEKKARHAIAIIAKTADEQTRELQAQIKRAKLRD